MFRKLLNAMMVARARGVAVDTLNHLSSKQLQAMGYESRSAFVEAAVSSVASDLTDLHAQAGKPAQAPGTAVAA